MKTEKMSFKNIKDVLSRDERKNIIGGAETWECDCGLGGWNGYGSNGDFRNQVIDMGCANRVTYCYFNNIQ